MCHQVPDSTSLSYESAISIRPAGQHDRRAVERFAALDSAAAPRGTRRDRRTVLLPRWA